MKSVCETKSRGHRTSKIVKSDQSYSNGHLPYHCSFQHLEGALDAWRGMWIGVRSKDAQKQLARTSLNLLVHHQNIFGSSSKVFGNLRKFSENVRERSFCLRNNFKKSSEIFGKSSKTPLSVCLYNKKEHYTLARRFICYLPAGRSVQ